jgi:hypothetical protein
MVDRSRLLWQRRGNASPSPVAARLADVGADACLHILDDRAFRDWLVPAFKRLIVDGTADVRLADLARSHYLTLPTKGESQFARLCGRLTEDLAWSGDPRGTSMFDSWAQRGGLAEISDEAEALLFLFNEAVVHLCSNETFLARTIDVTFVEPVLEALGVSAQAPARRLLTALGWRGYVLGYRLGGAGEGAHGWLDADETRALALELECLPLPPPRPPPSPLHQPPPEEASTDEGDLPALVLSRISLVCRQAIDAGRGVAWINH